MVRNQGTLRSHGTPGHAGPIFCKEKLKKQPEELLTEPQRRSCNLYQSVFKTGGRPSAAMTTSAVLDDLIDALEMQSDSIFSYLDRDTGEVF